MELPGLLDQHEDNLLPKDGILEYIYPFIRTDYLEELISSVDWKQDHIQMFGKVTALPRLTAWYGDEGASYTYSGIENKPLSWFPLLLKLKKSVEQQCGLEFNSALLNYYRDGSDHMGWHSDDERELGTKPVIASLSFGAQRRFQLKHKTDKGIEVITLEPKSGSLIVMKDVMQQYWNHKISKTSKPIGPRVNITFRRISL
ncbi:MAG: alpha-ketoglutarate-dependent dioxygenase AlkB [Halobacteriovorax sp.]|nr:alpha-ketoglutarate-dependent dioxygenase AlkB [Halobacteriovorax sp.]|tara:strand:+ start:3787 stop:4389 length:603 start_codon:yes stop_codon:yes gene_type:complete